MQTDNGLSRRGLIARASAPGIGLATQARAEWTIEVTAMLHVPLFTLHRRRKASMLDLFPSISPAPDSGDPHLTVHSKEPFNAEPPTAQLRASFVTPVDGFYVRSHGGIPVIDAMAHRLHVTGRVATERHLSIDELRTHFAAQTVHRVSVLIG